MPTASFLPRFEQDATPYKESSGPSGLKFTHEVPERVSSKSRMSLGVSEGVLQGPFEPWPKKCSKVTLKSLKRHFLDTFKSLLNLEGPQGHFPRRFRAHPDFWRHSLGRSQVHFGPEAPEDSCRGSRFLNLRCLRYSACFLGSSFRFRLGSPPALHD